MEVSSLDGAIPSPFPPLIPSTPLSNLVFKSSRVLHLSSFTPSYFLLLSFAGMLIDPSSAKENADMETTDGITRL